MVVRPHWIGLKSTRQGVRTHQPKRITTPRFKPDVLVMAMKRGVGATCSCIPLGCTNTGPSRCSVHMTRRALALDKGFGKEHRVAIGVFPIGTQTTCHGREDRTGQIGKGSGDPKDQETGVVSNEKKTLVFLFFRTLQQGVTRRALEGSCRPAGSGDPVPSPCYEITYSPSGKAFEVKIMMFLHGPIPPQIFIRASKAYVTFVVSKIVGCFGKKV